MRKNNLLLLLIIVFILSYLITFAKNVFANSDSENPEKIVATSENNFKEGSPFKIKISNLQPRTCYVIEIQNLDKYVFLESTLTNSYNNDCAQFARKKGLHPYFVFDTHDTGATKHEFVVDDKNDLKNLVLGRYDIILNKKKVITLGGDIFNQVDEYVINIIKSDQNQSSTPTPQPSVNVNPQCGQSQDLIDTTPNAGLTYKVTWPGITKKSVYFGRSWDAKNPEPVTLDANNTLAHEFSAPSQLGTYEVYIGSDSESIQYNNWCPLNFKVNPAPAGTNTPTPIPRNTPIPKPTQNPDLLTSCPVCSNKFIWNGFENTCQNIKNQTEFTDPTSYVDCSASGWCYQGYGCILYDKSSDQQSFPPPAPVCAPGGLVNDKCEKVSTGLGIDIGTDPKDFIASIFGITLSLSGGIALLLIIYSGYKLMTSRGNAEKVQGAKETLTSTIVGLLFIIFSIFILELIGVNILHIPGWSLKIP
ncbi:MAG: pilin [Patescibacteria group bacterium]|nr:pilin [Patescibacteria group bacterium]